MVKKSRIHNIAEEANNIQDECYFKRSLANYNGSRNLCMGNFRWNAKMHDNVYADNNDDRLCFYIGNIENIRGYK